ncbi:MAG TPA: ABC transporter ATP-binding protein [Thermoanaerobaculia bacterium]|nr:ABC transporter ATP-binding protein [Thermoanaerobaculia bacterium]
MSALAPERGQPAADRPFLRVAGVHKAFDGTVVLDGVSFTVREGEVLALLGPSGSGKTTLLRLLAGFAVPDAGSLEVAGREVGHLPPARRGFGMVFQHYALFPHLDVGANVAFGLRARGVGAEEAARRVAEVLALVDLAGFERRAVGELSGGQQQRVAVARALAPEPRLLLLDEPLSNLDPALRERTRRGLKELVLRLGITTILVTHEQQEAFDLGNRIAVLYRGRLEQVGTAEELYERPATRFVAGFVGRANLLPGRWQGDAREVVLSAAPDLAWPGEAVGALSPGQEVELMLRPEGLELVPPATPGTVDGAVRDRLYGGATSLFRVAAAGFEVEVAAPSAAAVPGDRVAVRPRAATRGRVFPRAASGGEAADG